MRCPSATVAAPDRPPVCMAGYMKLGIQFHNFISFFGLLVQYNPYHTSYRYTYGVGFLFLYSHVDHLMPPLIIRNDRAKCRYIKRDGNGVNYNTYSSDQSPFFGETVTVDYTSSSVLVYQKTSARVNTMVIESVSLIESVLPKFVTRKER